MSKRIFDNEYEDSTPLEGDAARMAIYQTQPSLILPSGDICAIENQALVEQKNESAMSAEFVIVTRQKEPNRHGNKVQIKPNKFGQGLLVNRFEQNPLVLWEHNLGGYPFPVGLAQKDKGSKVQIRSSATKVWSTVFFNQQTEFAANVAALVFTDQIRMASVGYNIQKLMRMAIRRENDPEGVEDVRQYFGGNDFTQTELTEWSITLVGADADSLKQTASRRQVADQKLCEPIRRYIEASVGPLVKQNQVGFNGWSAQWLGEGDTNSDDTPGITQGTGPGEDLGITHEEIEDIVQTLLDGRDQDEQRLREIVRTELTQALATQGGQKLFDRDLTPEELQGFRDLFARGFKFEQGEIHFADGVDTDSDSGDILDVPEDFLSFAELQRQAELEFIDLGIAGDLIAKQVEANLGDRLQSLEEGQQALEDQWNRATGKLPD